MIYLKRTLFLLFILLSFPLYVIFMCIDVILLIPFFIITGEIMDPDSACMGFLLKLIEKLIEKLSA